MGKTKATRKKKTKTEEQKWLAAYRAACPRHVAVFETDLDVDGCRHVAAMADDLRQAGNEMTGALKKNYDQMVRTKAYRGLKRQYGILSEKMSGLKEDWDVYQVLDKERKQIGAAMNDMQERFHVTWNDLRSMSREMAKAYCVDAVFTLTRAEDIWRGMEKVLYEGAKSVHFKKRGDLPVIRAKQINRGIILNYDPEKDRLVFYNQQLGEFRVKIPRKDRFLQDEYAAMIDYFRQPELEAERAAVYHKTRTLIPVFRPCYCALVCREIRGKMRVYVQVTIAAPSCKKYDRQGNPRHHCGKGRVGVDLGTQSVAAVSDTEATLENLAERAPDEIQKFEKEQARLLRKMDRSRRATNPERFNEDGTYRKGSRGKWKNSGHYRKMKYRLHEQNRKAADTRKYANRELANKLRTQGNVCIIEPPNARKLQKKAKTPKDTDKTIQIRCKDGTVKTVPKKIRRKRFGRSIRYRCPGGLQAELKQKFGDGYKEVPSKYRASQYDFMLDDYIKKKLSNRWHLLPDGRKVQRDLMSAFLLYCSDLSYTKIDRERCLRLFDRFWERHQALIEKIICSGIRVCNSGIVA